MAARVIVAIENPQDIIVQSARPYGQRAVLKFAQYTGANAIAGRHTPGTFTNQLQTSFSEPRLLILTDPRTDHQVSILLLSLLFILPKDFILAIYMLYKFLLYLLDCSFRFICLFCFLMMLNCLQPIKEAALGNIPTIAFCDTDSPMRYVDIGIPANNKGKHSIGCLFWILARMVLQMRGVINQGPKWEVMVRTEYFFSLRLLIA